MKLTECLHKDWIMLVVMFILPIGVPLLMCYFFSGIYVDNIPFGIANLDNSSLSRSIVRGFEDHPGLDVNYYAASEADLQDAIREKIIYGGIIIPDNFSLDISQKKAPKAVLLIDATNLIIANNALGYSSAILGTVNAQYQLSFLEGKNMLPQAAGQSMASFSIGERILYDPQLSYMCYLLYIVGPLIIQFFYLIFYLLPVFIEEKKLISADEISLKVIAGRGRSLLMRITVMWAMICVSSFIGLCLSGMIFSLPVRGNVLAYFGLMIILLLNLTVMSLVLISFLNERNFTYFVEFYSIINILFVLTSGAVWPEFMLPAGFSQVVKSVWPYIHAALPLKLLNLKGSGWNILWPYMRDGLCFAFFWLVIAISLHGFKIHRRVSGKMSTTPSP